MEEQFTNVSGKFCNFAGMLSDFVKESENVY